MLGRNSDILVQELWREIRPVRPDERPELGMNAELLEKGDVLEGLHDGALKSRREIYLTRGPIEATQYAPGRAEPRQRGTS